jgi:hypothetical protein
MLRSDSTGRRRWRSTAGPTRTSWPSLTHAGDAAYHPCPEAFPDASIAAGTVTKHAEWNQSRIYPNTLRDSVRIHPGGTRRIAARRADRVQRRFRLRQPPRPDPRNAGARQPARERRNSTDGGGLRKPGQAARSRRRSVAAERHRTVAAQLRVRLAHIGLRYVPDRRNTAVRCTRACPHAHRRSRAPFGVRHQQRRHLRVHRGVATPEPLSPRAESLRLVHEYPRRAQLSVSDPNYTAQTVADIPSERRQ